MQPLLFTANRCGASVPRFNTHREGTATKREDSATAGGICENIARNIRQDIALSRRSSAPSLSHNHLRSACHLCKSLRALAATSVESNPGCPTQSQDSLMSCLCTSECQHSCRLQAVRVEVPPDRQLSRALADGAAGQQHDQRRLSSAMKRTADKEKNEKRLCQEWDAWHLHRHWQLR